MKTDTRQKQSNADIVSTRIPLELKSRMKEWADRHGLPLAWVVKRSIEVGWPEFQREPIPAEEGR